MKINSINTTVENYTNKSYNTTNTAKYAEVPSNMSSAQSFKGKAKKANWITRLYAKIYSELLYEKKWVQKIADKMSKKDLNKLTTYVVILGSAITSSVYVLRTLHNKALDDDARRTLAINDLLCFIIPTIGALTIDNLIKNWKKEKEYTYSGKLEHKRALAHLSQEEFEKSLEKQGKRLKGFGALMTLITTTLMYRYFTPVFVTPIANRIGAKRNAELKAQEAAKLAQQQNDNAMIKPLREGKNVVAENSGKTAQQQNNNPMIKPLREGKNVVVENLAKTSQQDDNSMVKPLRENENAVVNKAV